jgi:sugar phosphate isomerase/epimerase
MIAGSTYALPPLPAGAGPRDWERALRGLARIGFEAIDLVDSWLRFDLLDDAGLAGLGAAIRDAGLRLAGASVIRASMLDPDDGPANLARTLRAVHAAHVLGAPVLSIGFHRPLRGDQLSGPFWLVPHPEDDASEAGFARAAELLGRVCTEAAAHGITVALELHESTLLDRAQRVLRLIDGAAALGAASLGVNLDLGNLVRVPGPLAEPWQDTARLLAPHVRYWHVKNYLRLGHPVTGPVTTAPVGVGEGEIDYRQALRLVLGAGYRGPLCVEHHHGDALWALAQGREYLRAVLADLVAGGELDDGGAPGAGAGWAAGPA